MYNPIADFAVMRRDITAHSKAMDVWGKLLNIPPLLGALWFLPDDAAISVAIAMPVSLLIAVAIHKQQPLSRLIGLCHVVFIPALWLLYQAVDWPPTLSGFQVWAWYCLILMGVSVVLDVRSIFQYFGGNTTYD